MQVRLLGNVQAVSAVGGEPYAIGGPTQRRVLAALALRRNEVVSVPFLVDVMWDGDDLPARADHNIRSYVHRLRTAVGDDGERLETVSGGYRLRLGDDELDVARFEQLVATSARLADVGERTAALDALDDANRLWHGAAIEEFHHEDWARAAVARLDELRVELRTSRAELLLDSGRASAALLELESLVSDEPLRERPRALLMRALYESGRQAEALRAFQEFRRSLVDEIGVEPSADLVDLDRQIATGSLATSTGTDRTVGSYELHERIGEGAFAVVHRATQATLGRDVVIKIVRAELANQPEFIRRFEAEAQMVASIEHPNVIPLYDYWREPDRAFLVMRWMTGGSLESRLDRGPLSINNVLAVVDDIAAALDASHAAGVVHRDVKPANILFDEQGRAYLGDFGIALAADERTRPAAALSEGSPIYASPEQLRREPAGPEADVHALGIVAFTMLTGRTPFADSPDEATQLHRQLHDPIPSARALRRELPATVEDVIAAATAKDPSSRYPTAGGFAIALRSAAGNAETTPAVGTRPRANPYKGLQAFAETDAADFHGRERLVSEFVEQLSRPDARLLAVVGPSGSGKSSAVRAGLVPALRAGRVPGSELWFVTTMIPGARPYESLETALLRVAINPPAFLLDQLCDGDRGILRAVSRLLPDDDGVITIVVDQFEELFTSDVADDVRDRFLRALTAAVSEPGSPVRVILTLRADFHDRPLRHSTFAPLLKDNTVVVTPLAPDELLHAIATPAAAVGVAFEPGLVAAIVADVHDEPGALPLLQYALTRMFEATSESDDPNTITVEEYRSIGGLTGALALRAEELWRQADDEESAATRRLFGRLVQPGDGTEDTRRRATLGELGSTPALNAVIERFGRARLLTFDRDPATREPTVEIAHEAIIREWPRLRAWLEDDRDSLRIHRHLTTAATAWAERDRDPNELYRGARLEAGELLLDSDVVALNPTEGAFLHASVEQRAEVAAAEEGRVRRLRRLVAVAATVAVIALFAGAVAVWQWNRAGDQADRAEANAQEALDNAEQAERNAEEARANAVDARANAELANQNADTAEANALLADQRAVEAVAAEEQAELQRSHAELERLRAVARTLDDPRLAALLAVEAYRLDPTFESLDTLHKVLTQEPGLVGNFGAGPYSDGVPIDERTYAAATQSGAIEIWDLQTLTLERTIESSHGERQRLAWGGDGRVVAFDEASNATNVFDVATGASVATIQHSPDVGLLDFEVSPDGTSLAAGLRDGSVQIWSIPEQRLPTEFTTGADGVALVRWHPDGRRIAAGTESGHVQLWEADADPPRLEWDTPPPEDRTVILPSSLSFNPSGTRLVAGLGRQVGQLHTFDVATGQPAHPAIDEVTIAGFPRVVWTDETTILLVDHDATTSFDLFTGTSTPVLEYPGGAWSANFLPSLGRVVVSRTSHIEIWSPHGDGPLRRVLPYAPEHATAFADGNVFSVQASLPADGTTVLVSMLDSNLLIQPTYAFDLTEEPAPPSVREDVGFVVGVSGHTLDFQGTFLDKLSVRTLDPLLMPLGEPVSVPPDISSGSSASADGRFFTYARRGGKADLHRATGEKLGTLELGDPDEFASTFTSFTSDGEYVALSTDNSRSGIWRTSTLERVELPEWMALTWAQVGGPWIFVTLKNGSFQRYDSATLEPVGDPVVGTGGYASTFPTVDESHLRVTNGTFEDATKVFDLTAGRALGRDLPHVGLGARVEWNADGSLLVVPDPDGISLWNFDTDSWADIACRFAGRSLTRDEWEQLGPRTIGYRPTCEQYPIDT